MYQDTAIRLVLPLVFPAGLHPGAGKDGGNRLQIARDGQDRYVLRGTALAGALRHGYARARGLPSRHPEVDGWFGMAHSNEGERPSLLRVSDTVLDAAAGEAHFRHHNAMDRHTGAVRGQALFSVEALPPNTRGQAQLELACDTRDEGLAFLKELLGLFASGLVMGGSGARGIGRAELDAPVRYRCYDLTDLEQHAAFLDERYAASAGELSSAGDALQADSAERPSLCVDLVLAVPRGQDLLVGDGQALDYEMQPQRVRGADDQEYWRLPGSSLRGVFRAWFNRLAARDGHDVADSAARFREGGGQATGEAIAWAFNDDEQRREIQDALEGDPDQLERAITCPVMRLFGTSFARGRIHIGDSLVKHDPGQEQVRAHVAVDTFTGGANEGFFFQNTVLHGAIFPVKVTIDHPEQEEARWLVNTLRALDLGILRVGCSKASGRLALARKVTATGPHSDLFSDLKPRAREG